MIRTWVERHPKLGFKRIREKAVWQSLLAVALIFPAAYSVAILTWLYLLSFQVTPSGAITIIALSAHIGWLALTIAQQIRRKRTIKKEKTLGMPKRPFNLLPGLALTWAIMSIQAPIIPLAVKLSVPHATAKQWRKVADLWRHKYVEGFLVDNDR